MVWFEPKEYAKLQNETKNLKEEVAKWKKWWTQEAEKIEKALVIVDEISEDELRKRLKKTLSPKERNP